MEEWTPERTAALKEAIRLCAKKDMGGPDMGPPSGPPKKGGIDLAILLGGPKKKAG
jgi:hypothetical protein